MMSNKKSIYNESEKKLKQSEERLEDFFNLSSSLMVITNPKGEVFKINNSCKTILGYTKKEILKIGLFPLVHPDDIEKTNSAIEEQLKGNQILNFTNRYKNKNGSYKTLEWQATIVKDGFTYALANDVTEQNKTLNELIFKNEEKQKFNETVLDNLPADIAVFDKNHKYLYVNPNGIRNNEIRKWIIGKNDFDYCDLKDIDKSMAQRRHNIFNKVVKTKQEIEWVDTYNKDGKNIYIMRKFYPAFIDDTFQYVIGYGVDVSELKKAQEELNQLNSNLEGKVKERTIELSIANEELEHQSDIKEKRADELIIANIELDHQNEEKEKRADELIIANIELDHQSEEKEKRADELSIANKKLAFQNDEKGKRADELSIINRELAYQNDEKQKRADELTIANKELAYQNDEKEKRADELKVANKELAFQNEEKEKRADELIIANKELAYQNDEKEKRAAELIIANKELAYQNDEKEKRADELTIANKELAFQNEEKEKRADELTIANKELAYQNDEKEKRAAELIIANKELAYQNNEKEKRAAELIIANKELAYQNDEKEKRAAELIIANKELAYQNDEKEKRADELTIANKELAYQNNEKGKRANELNEAQKIAQFGSWLFNPSTQKAEWSDEMFRIWGFDIKKGAPDYDTILKRIHTDDLELFTGFFAKALNQGVSYEIEFRICIPNAEQKTLRTICQPVLGATGEIINISGTNQDITLQRQFDEAQVKHQRLKAIGEMSSSISHDFNNSLQGMMGNLEIIKLQNDLSDKTLDRLNSIGSIITDVTSRVNALQDFGDTEHDTKKGELLNLNTMIEETLKQSRPLWKDNIEKDGLKVNVKTNFGDIAKINCNKGELKSALYNLIKNSIEAMPKGGNITIKTGIKAEGIFATFTDTGIGMNKETKLKIFQPYYSTKGYELGRGLGMSGAYSIVKKYKGDIFVKSSELGNGTTIEIVFPISTQDEIKVISKDEPKDKELFNVLWVDDDVMLTESFSMLVEAVGHKCNVVNSGKNALEYLNNNICDIVFTDIGMPKMNGWELADAIRNKHGNKIKIVVVTGWDVDEEAKEKHGINSVLQKPFTLAELEKILVDV